MNWSLRTYVVYLRTYCEWSFLFARLLRKPIIDFHCILQKKKQEIKHIWFSCTTSVPIRLIPLRSLIPEVQSESFLHLSSSISRVNLIQNRRSTGIFANHHVTRLLVTFFPLCLTLYTLCKYNYLSLLGLLSVNNYVSVMNLYKETNRKNICTRITSPLAITPPIVTFVYYNFFLLSLICVQ